VSPASRLFFALILVGLVDNVVECLLGDESDLE
jgi:hypothetical protein